MNVGQSHSDWIWFFTSSVWFGTTGSPIFVFVFSLVVIFTMKVSDMWNVVDFITNSLYVATIGLRLRAYYDVRSWNILKYWVLKNWNILRAYYDVRSWNILKYWVLKYWNILRAYYDVRREKIPSNMEVAQVATGYTLLALLSLLTWT